jgi:hypothetical protein
MSDPQAAPALDPTGDQPLSAAQLADALLLDFVAPGLLHALGNHLFAIQGSAHVLGMTKQTTRHRETILESCGKAEHALDVLRHAGPEDADPPHVEQAGILLMRLAEVCRVPLRERGVRLELGHSSKDSPRRVDARTFIRAVCELLRCVALEVPACYSGELRLDLCEQQGAAVAVELSLRTDPGCLPFRIALPVARAGATGVIGRLGARVDEAGPDRLKLRIPSVVRRREA